MYNMLSLLKSKRKEEGLIMKRFSGILIFTYDFEELNRIIKLALNNLGFNPTYIDIFGNENSNDILYESNNILNYLDEDIITLIIKNRIDNEMGDFCWFRIKVDRLFYNTFSLEWSNSNLEFLLGNNEFEQLLGVSFICGYCYNVDDSFAQTSDSIDSYKKNYPNDKIRITKNMFGDKAIDVSKNWGRYEKTSGLFFIAAPLMWYGKEYYSLISKEKLLSFRDVTIKIINGNEVININLFGLYEYPSLDANRKKQEEFWAFFDLQNVINNYKKRKFIDAKTSTFLLEKSSKRKNSSASVGANSNNK
jgi:hypothetical protein